MKDSLGSGGRLVGCCRSRISGMSGLVVISGISSQRGKLMVCANFGLMRFRFELSIIDPVLPLRLLEIYNFWIHSSEFKFSAR